MIVLIVLLVAFTVVFVAVRGIRGIVNREITYRLHVYTGKAAILVGLIYIVTSCCGACALANWIAQGFPRQAGSAFIPSRYFHGVCLRM